MICSLDVRDFDCSACDVVADDMTLMWYADSTYVWLWGFQLRENQDVVAFYPQDLRVDLLSEYSAVVLFLAKDSDRKGAGRLPERSG